MLDAAEREDLRSSVRDLLGRYSTEDDVRRVMGGDHRTDEALWGRMADLGLPAVLVPEEHGGAGGTLADLRVVLEETGRVLACVPLLSSVHATAVLTRAWESAAPGSAESALASRLLGGVAGGGARLAVAVRRGALPVASDSATDGGWELLGAARFVLDAHRSTHLVVPARFQDGRPSLFVVEVRPVAVSLDREETLDQTRALTSVAFRHAPAQLLAGPGTAIEVTRDAEDVAGVALACELVGTAEAALDLASAYARTRMQFGRPIGSFQAVKHHCADMLLRVELTRTAALHAAESVADGASTARQRTRAALLARAYAADAAYACAATSLQVHGGIGFTWEHTAHLHLKRTQSARHLLGSPAEAKARLAALLDLTPG